MLAAAVLGTAATALSAGPAQATGETTLTADPLRTWQTDGIVWAMAYAKGIVYVGGTFSHIRPPGAAPAPVNSPVRTSRPSTPRPANRSRAPRRSPAARARSGP
ncbi:hypothetical protein Srufu_002340 [Streptomyces libani subsp. rufus]|nr:hypothetical protein Srufu_002340 [Streptomyces libani subsp. rufus]